jgi:peptide/nickel transport system substrate-binding protein
MPTKKTYIQEAADYSRERRWQERMLEARVPRSLVVRAGTLAAFGGASAISQLLAACAQAGSSTENLTAPSAEGAYKYSKYPYIEKYNWRNLPWGDTPYVDGTLVTSGSGANNWDMVRQSLTSYGQIMDNLLNKRYGAGAHMERDEIEGHIVDKWSHAPDYRYSDYHVRQGVRFHDVPPVNGRLLTAEDVKYSFDAYRTEGIARPALEIIDRIEVLPDKETVRFYLKRPVLNLDVTLASGDYWIFAREHREGPKDRWEQQPIGAGPFKMTYQKVSDRMETVRHEGLGRTDARWLGYQLPFLKAWNSFVLPTGVGTKASLRAGQIDFAGLTDLVDLQDVIATNPEIIIQVFAPNTSYGPYPWMLNLRDPLFQDIRVRRALSLAINRREMIETLVGGLGSGAYPISWPWLGLSDPLSPEELGQWQQYNPALAKQLLVEAGYPNGFEMEYMVSGDPINRDVMTQQMLDQIGVRVKFNQVESTVLTAARTNMTFKHAIIGTPQTGYDAIKLLREWYLPDSPRNWGGINDPAMTDLVQRATYTVDPDEQQRLLWQVHERYLDQAYSLQFYVAFTIHARQPWMHNVASAVQGYFNAYGYHQVTIAWLDDKAPGSRSGHLKA